MALSALLLGLVPVVGGNVLPIDILSLSFWIAEGDVYKRQLLESGRQNT